MDLLFTCFDQRLSEEFLVAFHLFDVLYLILLDRWLVPLYLYFVINLNFWLLRSCKLVLCYFNTTKKTHFKWLHLLLQDIKPGEDMICQQYVAKPFLIDGFKFDLRIYALVTSCDPLRIFIFNDGLGRFTTVQYTEPTTSNLVRTLIYFKRSS